MLGHKAKDDHAICHSEHVRVTEIELVLTLSALVVE